MPINVAPSPGLFIIRVGKPEAAKEVYQKALADERISRGSKTNFEAKLRAFTTPKNRQEHYDISKLEVEDICPD